MLSFQSSVSLLPYNTFHLDVQAKYFVEITAEETLQELFASEIFQKEKKLILGGGANILLTQNFDGLVIKVSIKGIQKMKNEITQLDVTPYQTKGNEQGNPKDEKENTTSHDAIFVRVGAGENRTDFVQYATTQGRAGIENLIAIPGQVGTAPVSNIGAYGMEAQQHIARVEGYNLSTGQRQTFSNEECEFAYRSSIFKTKLRNQFLITQVVRKLEPFNEAYQFTTQYPDIQEVLKADKTPLSLVRISDIISTIRAKKLPDRHLIGTAGSFFANPYISIQHFETLKKRYPFLPSYPFTQQVVKIPAARLIEQAGLKGYSNGKAGTSPQHALIIINERGSPKDILEVVKHIQHTVKAKFGITLQPEVVYV